MNHVMIFPFYQSQKTGLNLERLTKLHNFLQEQPDQLATMQTIKRGLGDWQQADRDMEAFVSQRVMERFGKVYKSLLPTLSKQRLEDLEILSQDMIRSLFDRLKDSIPIEQTWLYTVASLQLREEIDKNLIVVPANIIQPIFSAYQQSGRYLFVDVDALDHERPSGLASYFAGEREGVFSQSILAEIGDVNADYFLGMSAKQLALLAEGQKPRVTRNNLFLDTLKKFHYATSDNHLVADLQYIEETEFTANVILIKQEVVSIVAAQPIKDQEKNVLIALVINQLLESHQGSKQVIRLKKRIGN